MGKKHGKQIPEEATVTEAEAQKNRTRLEAEHARLGTAAHLGFWSQTRALFNRQRVTIARDPQLTKMRVFQTFFLAIIIGSIYWRSDNDQRGTQNRVGSAFFIVVQQVMPNVMSLAQTFPIEKHILIRESRSGLYSTGPYFVARTTCAIAMETVYPVVFGTIVYYLIGFDIGQPADRKVELFLIFQMVLVLVSFTAASLGYLVSAKAQTPPQAVAMAIPVILPLMIFGGLFVNSESVPLVFIPLEAISFFKYAFHLLGLAVFKEIEKIDCGSAPHCQFRTGQDVINFYSFEEDNFNLYIGLLIGLGVGLRLLAFYVLRKSLKKD